MSTPVVILLVAVAAVALFTLAWWSSGRSGGAGYRTSGGHEAMKGLGTLQGSSHNPPGSQGHPFQ